MRRSRSTKGFTLTEILMTIVIIGVIAGIAVPQYVITTEKSRSQEALDNLAAARDAMTRYFAVNGTYLGASFPGDGSIGLNMDYNPNSTQGAGTAHFTYAFTALAAGNYTVQATRQGGLANGSTLSMTDQGVITKTGVYNT